MGPLFIPLTYTFCGSAPKHQPRGRRTSRPESMAFRAYAEYVALHDYFGRGGNDVMKRLKALKAEVRGG